MIFIRLSGVDVRPKPLSELIRVVAFCGASQTLRQYVELTTSLDAFPVLRDKRDVSVQWSVLWPV